MSRYYTPEHSPFVYELVEGKVIEHNPFTGVTREAELEILLMLTDLRTIRENQAA
jgi:hypothetical protein